MSEPIKVCVTGAAGQLAYSLLYCIAKGNVFGHDQPIIMTLLDIENKMEVLKGVVMELVDCCFAILKEVIPTCDEKVAFSGVDAAFLVASMPLLDGMERKDLLPHNIKIFKSQGAALDSVAKKSVKVVVVGNPVNTNAFICSKFAPSIPRENFSCLTRLDHNRAQAQIAHRLKVSCSDVSNVIIWGNHDSTMFPDVHHASVVVKGKKMSVVDAIKDKDYIEKAFISIVQERWAEVAKARKMTSAMSAANAAADHMHDWWFGTEGDKWVSMGVFSSGEYGMPKDVLCSFPVHIAKKQWTIVKGLELNEFAHKKIAITAKDLTEEKDTAVSLLQKEK